VSSSPGSNTAGPEEEGRYRDAWSAIYELIDSGKSWSGKERNCCFLNLGNDQAFADVSAVTGLDLIDDGRVVAVTDWDFDGKLDFWLSNRTAPRVRFLKNESMVEPHFLALRLQGTQCNRDAIGARVELHRSGATPMIKTLHAGDGYLAQSSKWLHFGLGTDAAIEHVIVRWPGGESETFTNILPDQHFLLVQRSGRAQAWKPRREPVKFASHEQSPVPPESSTRTSIVGRIPMLDVTYQSWNGSTAQIKDHQGKPLLINLWSTTCGPCLHELNEWSNDIPEMEKAGLNILALCVDKTEAQQAQKVLKKIGFNMPSGMASDDLVNAMEIFHRAYLESRRRLPVPCSFLLDREGRVAVIYKGRVSSKQLMDDVALLEATPHQRRAAAVPFAGRWTSKPLPADPRPVLATIVKAGQADNAIAYAKNCLSDSLIAEAHGIDIHRLLGDLYLDQRKIAAAVKSYQQILTLSPKDVQIHLEIGQQLIQVQEPRAAIPHLSQAAAIQPNNLELRLNLSLLQLREQQFNEAIPHLKAVIKQRPDIVSLRIQLAQALERTGDRKESIQQYQQVLKRSPGHQEAIKSLHRLQSPGSG